MNYPDCPKCGWTVLCLAVERVTYEVPGAGWAHALPSVPIGYAFEPCRHRLILLDEVEAYTAAGRAMLATRNSDNLTP